MSPRCIAGIAVAVIALLSGCELPPATPNAECASPPLRAKDAYPNAVDVTIVVENGLGAYFDARSLCLSVDGHRVDDTAPATQGAALREGHPVKLEARLRPDIVHRIRLVAVYVGTGRFADYTFQITSEREIAPAELRAETVTALIKEVALSPQTPLERRPHVDWAGPGHTVKHGGR